MPTDTPPLTTCAPADGPRVVSLSGELDIETVGRIEPHLAALAACGAPELVLDLSEVTFCDGSGVNLFLRLRRRCAAAHTGLRLRSVPGAVGRVLRLLAVDRVVPCTFQ